MQNNCFQYRDAPPRDPRVRARLPQQQISNNRNTFPSSDQNSHQPRPYQPQQWPPNQPLQPPQFQKQRLKDKPRLNPPGKKLTLQERQWIKPGYIQRHLHRERIIEGVKLEEEASVITAQSLCAVESPQKKENAYNNQRNVAVESEAKSSVKSAEAAKSSTQQPTARPVDTCAIKPAAPPSHLDEYYRKELWKEPQQKRSVPYFKIPLLSRSKPQKQLESESSEPVAVTNSAIESPSETHTLIQSTSSSAIESNIGSISNQKSKLSESHWPTVSNETTNRLFATPKQIKSKSKSIDDTNSASHVRNLLNELQNGAKQVEKPETHERRSSNPKDMADRETFETKEESMKEHSSRTKKRKSSDKNTNHHISSKRRKEITPPVPNIDKNMWNNGSKISKCVICKSVVRNIIEHYVSKHPNSEVYHARMSPTTTESVKMGLDNLIAKHQKNKIDAFCPFCEREQSFETAERWCLHLSKHTGEYTKDCKRCKEAPEEAESVGKPTQCVHSAEELLFSAHAVHADLCIRICSFCNYSQLKEESIEHHLRNTHQIEDNLITCYYILPVLRNMFPASAMVVVEVKTERDLDSDGCKPKYMSISAENMTSYFRSMKDSTEKAQHLTRYAFVNMYSPFERCHSDDNDNLNQNIRSASDQVKREALSDDRSIEISRFTVSDFSVCVKSSEIVYTCFVKEGDRECNFEADQLYTFASHLNEHSKAWNGFCYSCRKSVDRRELALDSELLHLTRAHLSDYLSAEEK